ncbi:maleylpyruvate isomerase family mycothiol-dependent enzyme [Mycolicibacterium sp. XJ870]
MERVAIIRAESQRLADVLAGIPPDGRCPTCPEWSAADLLWHLTEVHFFWAGVLARNARTDDDLPAVEQAKPARPGAVSDMLALRERATTLLLEQLRRLDDSEPRWSWWPPDQTVGFTRRMQTYEATMHRVDAELAAAVPIGPIDAEVAAGAVDHAVDVMWGWQPEGTMYEPAAVVEFVAPDVGQRWLVEVGVAGELPRATRATGGEPTARATAPVAELALWAWTRVGSVDISGVPASVAALEAIVNRGMP